MGKGSAKKATSAAESQQALANTLGDISKQMFQEATPWRQKVGTYLSDIISNKGDALQRSLHVPLNAATRQFSLARQSILNQLPAGGMRDAALRDVAIQQAGTKASIYSGGVNDAVARLGNFSMGQAQSGITGLGGAGGMFGEAGSTFANLASGKAGAAGSGAAGAGAIAGALI